MTWMLVFSTWFGIINQPEPQVAWPRECEMRCIGQQSNTPGIICCAKQ